MTKTRKIRLVILAVAAVLVAAFLTVLFLSLPLGTLPAVLPTYVLYIVGGVIAALFIAFGITLLISRKKRG